MVGLAVAPAFAPAAPPWLAPQTISAPGERAARGVHLAVNPSGDAVAAWVVQREGAGVVRAATREARGPWSNAVDVSGAFNRALQDDPVAMIGSGGDAAIAWLDDEGRITVAIHGGATGAWHPPDKASPPVSYPFLRVAMEPSGALVAVWSRGLAVEAAARSAETGRWSGPRPISGLGQPATLVGLSSNRSGSMVAWWGSHGGPQFSLRPPGGEFSAPLPIPGVASLHQLPEIAIGADGHLEIVQARTDDDGGLRVVEAATRPPGGPVGPFEEISSEISTRLLSPRIAVDDRGNALVAWERTVIPGPRFTLRLTTLRVAERPAGGSWGAPRELVPQHTNFRGMGLNAAGSAIVLFDRPRRRVDVVEAAVRPGPKRAFLEPEDVVPRGASQPAIDGDGVAAVAYVESGGRVESILRARSMPGDARLAVAQVRINQRISQAAVRRANAIEERLAEGMAGSDIRPGALGATAFAPGVDVAGQETGALTPPGPGRPLVVPPARRGDAGDVRLAASQLLINQRISQAAVRRANRLAELFAGGLTGAHVADGAIGPEHLAPGLSIAGAAAGGATPAPPEPEPTAEGRQGGRMTLSAAQLRINQRISQAAVRRLNSLVAQLERGLPGSSFAPGSITAADLAPELRR